MMTHFTIRRVATATATLSLTVLLMAAGPVRAQKAPKTPRPKGTEMITMGYTVKVPHPDRTMRDFIKYASTHGGYLLRMYPGGCVVALPRYTPLGDIAKKVAAYGTVVDRSLARNDVGERMVVLKTAIRVKKKHLANLYRLFRETNLQQTLALEKEVRSVVQDLERQRGLLRYYQSRLANVRVELRFRHVRKVDTVRGRAAPWAWIRGLNLQAFLRRFDRPASGDDAHTMKLPKGFARYTEGRGVRGISPVGIRMASRSLENKPASAPALWTESVRLHLQSQGYRLLSDAELSAGKLKGRYFVSIYRYKNHDFAYLTALLYSKKRIYVVESAGPFPDFKKRQADLLRAVESLRLK